MFAPETNCLSSSRCACVCVCVIPLRLHSWTKPRSASAPCEPSLTCCCCSASSCSARQLPRRRRPPASPQTDRRRTRGRQRRRGTPPRTAPRASYWCCRTSWTARWAAMNQGCQTLKGAKKNKTNLDGFKGQYWFLVKNKLPPGRTIILFIWTPNMFCFSLNME